MQIIPNQAFKHDGKTFEEGQSYEVSEADAEYFRQAGWVGSPAEPQSYTLDVQDIILSHSMEVN